MVSGRLVTVQSTGCSKACVKERMKPTTDLDCELPRPIESRLSALALLTFGARKFFVVGVCCALWDV